MGPVHPGLFMLHKTILPQLRSLVNVVEYYVIDSFSLPHNLLNLNFLRIILARPVTFIGTDWTNSWVSRYCSTHRTLPSESNLGAPCDYLTGVYILMY